MEQPVLRKKKTLSPVWILPLVALIIGGWLLYTSYRDAGVNITIHFSTAKGITPGKTKVMYRGIPVGTVEEVQVDKDLEGVNLMVEMDRETRSGLMEDTQFWIVRPEISAGRISGLETLLSGSYIGVQKGQSTTVKTHFEGLSEPPPPTEDSPGLHITLETDTLYSLQKGSNIYAKNLQIGHVKNYSLNDNGKISLEAYIKPEYTQMIKTGTSFWNASGLSLTGDLQSGLTVNLESIASLIYGGIACATPPSLADSAPAENNHTFTLFKDFEDAEYGIPMTLQLASGEGIIEGKTRIMFRGLKAGVVKKIDINNNTFHTVTASILLDPRAKPILRQETRFWVIRPEVSFNGIQHLDTLLTGPYITFDVGTGPFQDHFTVESVPMPKPMLRAGTRYSLSSKDSGSLEIGTPVLYKKMTVGEITDIAFSSQATKVRTEILIYQPFAHLVRSDSVFWNVSGIRIDGSLSSFEVNLASLQTMLAGGVSFINPDNGDTDKAAVQAEADTVFTLYEGYGDAVKSVQALQPAGLRLQLQAEKMPALSVGAPVLYNNIAVGKVLEFNLAGNRRHVMVDVLIEQQYQDLVSSESRFYNFSGFKVKASLKGVSLQTGSLDSILSGGISFFNPAKGKPVKNNRIFPLHQDYESAVHADSLHLTLHFDSAAGINEQTQIKYQGIVIGLLTKVRFDHDLSGVIGEAVVEKKTTKLFRRDSILYLTGPKFGLSGVEHLDTILTGAYIDVTPGTGEPHTEFTVLTQQPGGNKSYAGLNIILDASGLGSLKKGSPIYYRQIQVGRITGFELSPTAQTVWVRANIHPAYTMLIYQGTKFWNVSGIRVTGGVFSGLTVDTESMEALVTGGVALATPEGEEMGRPAENGDHFALIDAAKKEWEQWRPELPFKENLSGETTPIEVPAENVLVNGQQQVEHDQYGWD